MTRRQAVHAGFVAVLAFGIGGCSDSPTYSYRFKLTVEVSTPEGMRSGSSVYEVFAKNLNPILPDEADRTWSTKGEAVAVDLPQGQTLFALLKTGAIHGDMASLSMAALDPAFNNDVVESVTRISLQQGITSPAVVKRSDGPLLARFKNPNDPKSIEIVDPDNLAAAFGDGFSLNRILLEITDLPVTSSIKSRLPSDGAETGFDKWYRDLAYGDPRQITKDDFIGSKK